jgi:MoaA/NifB/PqqE/SkfB family radical SAM enzyme
MAHPAGIQMVGPQGDQRGFVDPKLRGGRPALEDLWVLQGSLCDLKCQHCYTASSPSNDTLEQIRFDELRPHLDDARRWGVRKIYFTGGEVFVNQEVLTGRAATNAEFWKGLEYALFIAPTEILTNGRRYIRNHFEALHALFRKHGDRLRLRITLESFHRAEHDAIRGRGTFDQTVATVCDLASMGFVPIINAERPFLSVSADDEIRRGFLDLFASKGVTVEVNVIENVIEMGHQLVRLKNNGRQPSPEVFITTKCFDILNKPAESLMCHYSRCVQKIGGRIRYYPCPVIYDDERFDLGGTLEESFQRIYLGHKNCYDYCMKGRGATCRTQPIGSSLPSKSLTPLAALAASGDNDYYGRPTAQPAERH